MAYGVAWDERTVRQRALVLLSVADSVKREGWDDVVAAQLRQAAHDLLGMATGAADTFAAKEVARLPLPLVIDWLRIGPRSLEEVRAKKSLRASLDPRENARSRPIFDG